ncbi:hypothetical protein CJU90_3980 [Yarrowia sp. C11]|nr:hypothetical protein CJU90_3980 [Yarrowia sp. C11]
MKRVDFSPYVAELRASAPHPPKIDHVTSGVSFQALHAALNQFAKTYNYVFVPSQPRRKDDMDHVVMKCSRSRCKYRLSVFSEASEKVPNALSWLEYDSDDLQEHNHELDGSDLSRKEIRYMKFVEKERKKAIREKLKEKENRDNQQRRGSGSNHDPGSNHNPEEPLFLYSEGEDPGSSPVQQKRRESSSKTSALFPEAPQSLFMHSEEDDEVQVIKKVKKKKPKVAEKVVKQIEVISLDSDDEEEQQEEEVAVSSVKPRATDTAIKEKVVNKKGSKSTVKEVSGSVDTPTKPKTKAKAKDKATAKETKTSKKDKASKDKSSKDKSYKDKSSKKSSEEGGSSKQTKRLSTASSSSIKDVIDEVKAQKRESLSSTKQKKLDRVDQITAQVLEKQKASNGAKKAKQSKPSSPELEKEVQIREEISNREEEDQEEFQSAESSFAVDQEEDVERVGDEEVQAVQESEEDSEEEVIRPPRKRSKKKNKEKEPVNLFDDKRVMKWRACPFCRRRFVSKEVGKKTTTAEAELMTHIQLVHPEEVVYMDDLESEGEAEEGEEDAMDVDGEEEAMDVDDESDVRAMAVDIDVEDEYCSGLSDLPSQFESDSDSEEDVEVQRERSREEEEEVREEEEEADFEEEVEESEGLSRSVVVSEEPDTTVESVNGKEAKTAETDPTETVKPESVSMEAEMKSGDISPAEPEAVEELQTTTDPDKPVSIVTEPVTANVKLDTVVSNPPVTDAETETALLASEATVSAPSTAVAPVVPSSPVQTAVNSIPAAPAPESVTVPSQERTTPVAKTEPVESVEPVALVSVPVAKVESAATTSPAVPPAPTIINLDDDDDETVTFTKTFPVPSIATSPSSVPVRPFNQTNKRPHDSQLPNGTQLLNELFRSRSLKRQKHESEEGQGGSHGNSSGGTIQTPLGTSANVINHVTSNRAYGTSGPVNHPGPVNEVNGVVPGHTAAGGHPGTGSFTGSAPSHTGPVSVPVHTGPHTTGLVPLAVHGPVSVPVQHPNPGTNTTPPVRAPRGIYSRGFSDPSLFDSFVDDGNESDVSIPEGPVPTAPEPEYGSDATMDMAGYFRNNPQWYSTIFTRRTGQNTLTASLFCYAHVIGVKLAKVYPEVILVDMQKQMIEIGGVDATGQHFPIAVGHFFGHTKGIYCTFEWLKDVVYSANGIADPGVIVATCELPEGIYKLFPRVKIMRNRYQLDHQVLTRNQRPDPRLTDLWLYIMGMQSKRQTRNVNAILSRVEVTPFNDFERWFAKHKKTLCPAYFDRYPHFSEIKVLPGCLHGTETRPNDPVFSFVALSRNILSRYKFIVDNQNWERKVDVSSHRADDALLRGKISHKAMELINFQRTAAQEKCGGPKVLHNWDKCVSRVTGIPCQHSLEYIKRRATRLTAGEIHPHWHLMNPELLYSEDFAPTINTIVYPETAVKSSEMSETDFRSIFGGGEGGV